MVSKIILKLLILLILNRGWCFATQQVKDRPMGGGNKNVRQLGESPVSNDFEAVFSLINNATNLIYKRYEFQRKDTYQFFQEVTNMPPYSWDIQKYKIAKKMVDGNSAYLMVFGGSSVTAGHDNFYYQAHPFVFERKLKPIFDRLGVKLIVRNIAQGANNCRPSMYCYESMGGEGADFVGWEQSFNCGRDRTVFEYVARVAAWSNAVIYYMASGGWMPSGCPPSKTTPARIREEWTPEGEGIMQKIPPVSEETVKAYKDMSESWNGDGNAASKFSSYYGGLYKPTGPWGFNFWAHSSKLCDNGKGCNAIDKVGACAAQGGPNWITEEAAWYAGEKGKRGKSWHPSAGMHLLRGEVLAYQYLQIVADAIFTVQRGLKDGSTTEQLSKVYAEELEKLQVKETIPEKALYVTPDEGLGPPHCFTNYEPHFNIYQRLDNLIMGNHTGWKHSHYQTWSAAEKRYGYADTKPFYEAVGASKELHLRIMDVRYGSIRVCGYSRKGSLAHATFYLDAHYPFKLSIPLNISAATGTTPGTYPFGPGVVVNATAVSSHGDGPFFPIPYEEYVQTTRRALVTDVADVGDDCVKLANVPKGNHVLTIVTDPQHPKHVSTVSHVIIF